MAQAPRTLTLDMHFVEGKSTYLTIDAIIHLMKNETEFKFTQNI